MRFRFCGDLDCPDWVLAEISILSKITSIKMKQLCVQVVKNLLGDEINYEKVYKLTSDAKYEVGDVKASIAALGFILTSAAKYNVDGDSLSNELQQLGLPKEHSTALCRAYGDKHDNLQQKFREQSFRVLCSCGLHPIYDTTQEVAVKDSEKMQPHLENKVSKLESVDWRVDYVLSSSELKEVNEPSVQLRLRVKNPDTDSVEPTSLSMSADKFRIFLSELKQTQKLMDGLV